jgi:hypothetical protein
MHFKGRELKPHAEPISAAELEPGEVYFSLYFIDDDMLIPILEPVVFIGKDLEPGDADQVYFQDIDSYRRGVCYTATPDGEHATFFAGPENELQHIFDYEHALEVLMACSLRRSSLRKVIRGRTASGSGSPAVSQDFRASSRTELVLRWSCPQPRVRRGSLP